ncbi:MAG TPA: efflux RND transporter permease subunit [Cytophagaceae bacterium]|nr:efflux RND transporter permease subunit [Cytophagaceae bacterium]
MKEFKASSWSIDNKTTIYVVTAILALVGYLTYNSLPKEQFPEVVFPQIYVNTQYLGASPTDIENAVTKHIEKQVKAISGVKKITSKSEQNVSVVIVEFNTDEEIAEAKIKVKDAVDKAKVDLPKNTNLKEPQIIEVDVSQIPIMNINISGDYDLDRLKKYAEDIQDRIESMKEITRVDLIGALDREFQINLDRFKMDNTKVTFYDVMSAVGSENISAAGGEVVLGNVRRSLQVKGEFKNVEDIKNLVIRSGSGAVVYLKDIAEVVDGHKEKETFARLDYKNVITLSVVKRSGENLIEASDKIRAVVKDMQENKLPKDLKIVLTGDQSKETRTTLHDLINTIIIGFILVTVILMFFMGTTNAIFVAMSVPLSMCMAFIFLDTMDFTLNMIVLFAFLLALGIVVDDAIVVIENTHRIYDNGKVPIIQAAKEACGEVFVPVLAGTVTTLAPFIPLAFWKGVIGEFMFYLPITLIVTLVASLVVAYIINPIFAVDFMKPHDEEHDRQSRSVNKGFWVTAVIFAIIALIGYSIGVGLGNFIVTMFVLYCLNRFLMQRVIKDFQEKRWPKFQNAYANSLKWALKHPYLIFGGTIFLLFFSGFLISVRAPKVVFFPQSEPNFIFTNIVLPIGTDQKYTDSITQIVEKRVFETVNKGYPKGNPIVESVIANVGKGAGDQNEFDFGTTPNKGKITVAFVEFARRNGQSTAEYLDKIREAVKGIPGAQITVNQEQGGPPVGKPINIEITGDRFDELIATSEDVIKYLNNSGIGGIEELKTDLVKNKPEVLVEIDREKANAQGISTKTISDNLFIALYGLEASKFRDANDEYPIQVRYQYNQRNDVEALLNMSIVYRDMNMGGALRQVPLSSVARVRYTDTYGGINRKNQKRMITVYSNILSGYNANEVVAEIQKVLNDYDAPEGVMMKMTGEQEDQAETSAFLGWAVMVAFFLIFGVLVLQFNSISKPFIILTEILFSIIGVLLGFAIFKMDISIIMTGVGVIALTGIVVRNGILLVEFTDHLKERGLDTVSAIIEAGRTRMTPVLLTASATILGLIPLAVGLNIDFVTLFTEGNPHIFFGGDSVAFWGPLSWTMIYGLAFATFLTLILVPVLYELVDSVKVTHKGLVDQYKIMMAFLLPLTLVYFLAFAIAPSFFRRLMPEFYPKGNVPSSH